MDIDSGSSDGRSSGSVRAAGAGSLSFSGKTRKGDELGFSLALIGHIDRNCA